MPLHEYTAEQALALLVRKLEPVAPVLSARVQEAVNAGSEMQAEEDSQGRSRRGRKPKKHVYRKTVPYTAEEAVAVAVGVLKAHLVESRAAIQTASEEFMAVAVAPPRKPPRRPGASPYESALGPRSTTQQSEPTGVDQEKLIEVETEPETVQEKRQEPNIPLKPEDPQLFDTLQHLVTALEKLTTFEESAHGNASGS